jgi:S1-C subfamily serine protease/dienelactone hydrolase
MKQCNFVWTGVILVCCPPLIAQEINDDTEKAMKAAVLKVAPSVVQIETSGGADVIGTSGPGGPVRKGTGPTTGVIVSADGYIISSAFNFANKPSAVFVTVPGRKERLVAKTVATDTTRMLTLIKVEIGGLPVPQPSPKAEFQIGQWSLALGRTLDPNVDNPPSVSVGIISALHRIWGKAVQTDAKVSPVNYGGPLIDVDGRIQGILVPASPFAEGDTAGVEWYDSGIGFAIPFEDVLAVLNRLKAGKDLRKGMLGVTPTGRDIYSGLSTVSAVAADSPAARAGIQSGDQIIEVDGKPVRNHAQVQHALGPKYEGDTVSLKVKRGNDTKEFANLVLSGSLTAYVQPFLGILPIRDDPESGLEVRYVFPKSPADMAGIKPGDRLLKLGPAVAANPMQPSPLRPFTGREQLKGLLATLAPHAEVNIELKRKSDGKTAAVKLRLSAFDSVVPDELPEQSTAKKALTRPKPGPMPMPVPPKPMPEKKVETGLLKRTNAAQDHEYWVYVPENYDPNVSHGLIVWLHGANQGGKDSQNLTDIWGAYCAKHHMILVGPKSENESGWVASESEFIAQTARDMISEFTIDRQRVIVHGMGIGGQMAFYLGFSARDLIRGVATTSSILASAPKETQQNQPLAFFIVAGGKDPLSKQIAQSRQVLADKKYPVIFREIAEMGKEYLTEKVLQEMIRWLDSLDRI